MLNIGQLVAAIAAYKELPPPIKDLIDWDQARADVVVRYEQIVSQFPSDLLPTEKHLTARRRRPTHRSACQTSWWSTSVE